MAPAKAKKAVEIFNEEFRREELNRRAKSGADELSRTELSKLCATRWKELSDGEKSRYAKLAAKENGAVQKDSGADTDSEEDEPAPKPKAKASKTKAKAGSVDRDSQGKENKKKAKKEKDPNAPKRATTSFFVFGAEMRPIVKSENPNMKPQDVAKEMGRLWKELSDSDKARYEAVAKEDKKRYQRELEDYKNA